MQLVPLHLGCFTWTHAACNRPGAKVYVHKLNNNSNGDATNGGDDKGGEEEGDDDGGGSDGEALQVVNPVDP
jgi:hypothetical protein